MILRSLDDRLVPRMAAGLRRLIDRVTPGRSAAPRATVDVESRRGGLLGLLRDVPQLAALLAALLFLGVAGLFALTRSGDDRVATAPDRPAASTQPSAAAARTVLGPEEGAQIDPYLVQERARLTRAAAADPDERYVALVMLSDYATPTDAATLLGGVDAQRVFLRAKDAGDLAEVLEVPVSAELVSTLSAFYARTAAAKQEDATEFRALADSIEETSAEETAAKQAYVDDSARASAEATAYASDCACVFTVAVEGTAEELLGLASDPQVRGVALADPGVELAALEVLPLAPEQQGVLAPLGGASGLPGEEGQ